MIITEYIEIEISKTNVGYYRHLGYDINIGDLFKLKISDLPKGSNKIISAKCSFCDNIVDIKYKLYTKRIDKHIEFACSKKCASIRTGNMLFEKHGVRNISQVSHVKDKIKETNLEKWGNEFYIRSIDARQKSKETLIRKFGFDNPLKNFDIREKIRQTNLTKYGTEYTLQVPEIRDSIKKTNLEKYGNEVASKSSIVIQKIKDTNLEKWGFVSPMLNPEIIKKSKETLNINWVVDSPIKSPEIKERIRQTNLKKYGVEYPMQSEIIKKRQRENSNRKWGVDFYQLSIENRQNYIICNDNNYIEYLGNLTSKFNCDLGLDHTFEIKTDNFFSRRKNNIKLCTICNPIGDKISIKQKDVVRYIESISDINFIVGYRDKLEIDIYIPELKLGFEFNGLYWHSGEFLSKTYHIDKMNYFLDKDIKIINIWEDEWDLRSDIIKSQISYLLGKSNKIHARKCIIKEVTNTDSSVFLNTNHIQGDDKSNIKVGLYYNDELVSLMTFNKFEGRKKLINDQWNLSRFCSKINFTIVGGASKLLNFFIKEYKPTRIISYADSSWSNGNVYTKLGFIEVSRSKSDYKYIVNGVRKHKQNFKKSNIKIEKITESQYTKMMGYPKIYDCGKIKYEKIILPMVEYF